MDTPSTPDGTGSGPLSINSAVDHLLATAAPEQEPPAEAEEQPAAEIEADADTDDAEDDAPAEAANADAEDDQDEVADEDDADGGEDGSDDYFTIRVDGEDIDVTLDELQKGYQRMGDYTRKTQAVAEDRKAVEAERQQFAQAQQELHQMREHLAARLQQADEMLQTGAGEPEPDWDRLRDEDPLEYMVQRDRYRDKQEQQRQIQQERDALMAQQNAVAQQQRAQHLENERAVLLDEIPEWRDEVVAGKEKSALVTYAQQVGYTEQELANASDSRAIRDLRKAMLWDALQDATPKARAKAKAAPKMVRAGKPKSKAEKSSRRLNRISKTRGRDAMEAAVDYLLES
jgi:small-conductance mechanosensitive channel